MAILNKPIEMIAINDVKGNVRPLRFRVDTDDGKQVCTIKVKTLDRYKDNLVYRCAILLNGVHREAELQYMLMEHKWILVYIK